MAHNYCPACSGEIPAGAQECPQCGRRNERQGDVPSESGEKRWRRLEMRGALLFGIGVVGFYVAPIVGQPVGWILAGVITLTGFLIVAVARFRARSRGD